MPCLLHLKFLGKLLCDCNCMIVVFSVINKKAQNNSAPVFKEITRTSTGGACMICYVPLDGTIGKSGY